MVQIPDLPLIDVADVDGDILFPCHDPAESGNQGKRITRDRLLNGYPANATAANFTSLTLTAALTGTTAAFTAVSLSTSLGFTGGATVTGLRRGSSDLTPADIAAGASEDLTITVSGVAIGDHVSLSFTTALPAGMTAQGWVSSEDTVSVRFVNNSAALIASATYTTSAMVARFA